MALDFYISQHTTRVHAKHVRQTAPCAVLGAGFPPQNAAGDGGLSYGWYLARPYLIHAPRGLLPCDLPHMKIKVDDRIME